jgi:hypothetical protein
MKRFTGHEDVSKNWRDTDELAKKALTRDYSLHKFTCGILAAGLHQSYMFSTSAVPIAETA